MYETMRALVARFFVFAAQGGAEAQTSPTSGAASVDTVIETLQKFFTEYGLQVLGAILIFVIGRWVAKALKGIVRRLMTKSKADPAERRASVSALVISC